MSNIDIIDGQSCLDEVVKLFAEYKNELNADLSFQPADESKEEIKVTPAVNVARLNDCSLSKNSG